jgi:hypothetical protein
MNPKSFIVLAVATAVFVVGAAIGVVAKYGTDATTRDEALMFPDLVDRLDEVAIVTVRHKKGDFTLERSEGTWVMAEKNGFPVPADKVRKIIVQLAGLRLLEAKTRKPERFARLQVEDVEADGAKSKIVILKDGADATLAEVIVGRYRFDLGGDGKEGAYVRRPGNNQAWLARGNLQVSHDITAWLRRDIVDVPAKRVREAMVTAPGGGTLSVFKEAPSDTSFQTGDVPADAKPGKQAPTMLNDIGGALSLLDLSDVAPVSQFEFDDDGAYKVEFHTFDGLIVRAALVEREKETWARFEAAADPTVAVLKEGDDAKGLKSAEDVAKEVAAINARVAAWAYRLSDYKAKVLKTQVAGLIEDESAK